MKITIASYRVWKVPPFVSISFYDQNTAIMIDFNIHHDDISVVAWNVGVAILLITAALLSFNNLHLNKDKQVIRSLSNFSLKHT